MQSKAELSNSTIGVQALRLAKPETRVTDVLGGEINLVRFYDRARGTKEYGTMVLGEPLNLNPGERLSRAQDAIDAAKAALPKIRAHQKAARAEAQAKSDAMLAEIKAETGDVGPQADDAPLDIEPVIDEYPQETVPVPVFEQPDNL